MPFRAFISVDLPDMPRLASFHDELRRASDALKMVAPDHLHLTLKFLGDTDEGLAPEIVTAIGEACHGISPFSIRVQGTGAFPSLSRMNVLWVGIRDAEPLARIADHLNASLQDYGFPREKRAFAAHVTLARVRGTRNLDRARFVLASHVEDLFAEVRVDEVRLKKSVLGPQGPTYTTVDAVRLEG